MAIDVWKPEYTVRDGFLDAGSKSTTQANITALANGGYVIGWIENNIVKLQIFDGAGNRSGGAFSIDATSTKNQTYLNIQQVGSDGSFVVTWTEDSTPAGGTTIYDVKARVFTPNAAGQFAPGSIHTVSNDGTSGALNNAALATRPDGVFVSAYMQGANLMFAMHGANGQKLHIEDTRIPPPPPPASQTSAIKNPEVTYIGQNKFVVSYNEGDNIRFRIVDTTNGSPALVGSSSVDTGAGLRGEVVALLDQNGVPSGEFTVVKYTYLAGNWAQITATKYNANGSPQGGPTIITKWGVDTEDFMNVTALRGGRFAVTYTGSKTDAFAEDDYEFVMLKIVEADGTTVSDPLVLSAKDDQSFPTISEMADGRLVATWQDWTRPNSAIASTIVDPRIAPVTVNGTAFNDIYVGSKFDGDRLSGNGGADQLYGGTGNDTLMGGAGADTLDGGAGTADWADYSDSNGVVVVDLRTGTGSGSYADGDVLRGIENLRGSNVINNTVKDILIGNEVANHIMGGAGDDWLYGGAGDGVADTLEGGGEYNRVTYEYSTAGVGITLDLDHQDRNTGEAKNDVFRNIIAYEGTRYADNMTGHAAQYNELYGNSGNDYLVGGDRNDYLNGGEGDDTLQGGANSNLKDELIGGNGFDYVSYANALGDVGASLGTVERTGDAFGDEYSSIEGLIGSAFADRLTGDGNANALQGRAGEDWLIGGVGNDTLEGGSESDALDGGDGFDYASYANASAGVTVQLNNAPIIRELAPSGFANDGYPVNDAYQVSDNTRNQLMLGFAGLAGVDDATGDRYDGIEGLIGSNHSDNLYGDAGNNHLKGMSGNDVLVGNAGNDTLEGGLGDDTYYVDAGDTIVEAAGQGHDTVVVTTGYVANEGAEIERVLISGGAAANITGNSSSNTLTGNDAGNTLDGRAGNDVLQGLGGNDALFGGEGHDVLDGGVGTDAMTGGNGNDTYYVDNVGDVVVETRGGGVDTVYASVNFTMSAGTEVEYLYATGSAALQLKGSDFANTITGNAGANKIYGGLGNDELRGGAGKDTFVFDTKPNKSTNVDRVMDFNVRDDGIYLDNKYFTKLGSGSLSKPKKFTADMFIKGTKAQDREDRIVYDKKTGSLYYDQDGTGSKAQVKIATLSKNLGLTHNDFYVI